MSQKDVSLFLDRSFLTHLKMTNPIRSQKWTRLFCSAIDGSTLLSKSKLIPLSILPKCNFFPLHKWFEKWIKLLLFSWDWGFVFLFYDGGAKTYDFIVRNKKERATLSWWDKTIIIIKSIFYKSILENLSASIF